MAFVSWPGTSIGLALIQSWTLMPQPDLRQTDYEFGPISQRTRQARVMYDAKFAMNMTYDDFAGVLDFYENSTHHGVDKFEMPIWDGEVYSICLVQMAEPYVTRYVAPDIVQVTLHCVVHNLPVLDDAGVWMVQTYGGDFTITFANELHQRVHVDYPACFPIPEFHL